MSSLQRATLIVYHLPSLAVRYPIQSSFQDVVRTPYLLGYLGATLMILLRKNLIPDQSGVSFLVTNALKKSISVTSHPFVVVLLVRMLHLMSHCRFFRAGPLPFNYVIMCFL